MAKKHQYKISKKATRSKAGRKWRRQAKEQLTKQWSGKVQSKHLPR